MREPVHGTGNIPAKRKVTLDQFLTEALTTVAASEEAKIRARKTRLHNSPEYRICQTCRFYIAGRCDIDKRVAQPAQRCNAWEAREDEED